MTASRTSASAPDASSPGRQSSDDLTDRIARAILEPDFATATGGELSTDEALALVRRCAGAEQITRKLLRRSVDAARAANHSWAAIGAELGMSRQAAQQRFGGAVAEPTSANERWLGPVTAFDEMDELALAGRLGWHTVEAGFLQHRMVRGDTQWEHRRLLWPRSTRALQRDGWQIGCRAFPWIYLVRDTGIPVEES